jgi:aminoglycoside phosphotransferase (APT) family kinase protein
VGTSTPGPALFFSSLLHFAFTYSVPVGGPTAAVRRALGRRPPPESFLRSALRLAPRCERPDLDVLALDLFAAWPRLVGEQGSPPVPDPATIDLLALERRSALTVFVFTGDDQPVLVAKLPRGEAGGPAAEAEALQAARGLAGAPRYLGRCRDAYVQEMVRGAPLPVEPLRPGQASDIRWDECHAQLAEGLRALTVAARTPGSPQETHPARVSDAVRYPGLAPATRAAVLAAADAVEALPVSVLKHGDLSPQNCLFEGSRFAGIVDWESAILRGTPGYDLLNAGVALLEHRLALYGSAPSEFQDAIVRAWSDSEYFAALRACIASEIRALDIDMSIVPAIEISFFARRLGHRLAEPERYFLGVEGAAGILEAVVAQRAATLR